MTPYFAEFSAAMRAGQWKMLRDLDESPELRVIEHPDPDAWYTAYSNGFSALKHEARSVWLEANPDKLPVFREYSTYVGPPRSVCTSQRDAVRRSLHDVSASPGLWAIFELLSARVDKLLAAEDSARASPP